MQGILARINEQQEKIDFLSRLEFATAASGGLTQGSVVFAGSGGILSQSNTKLYWDNTNNRFAIGHNSPTATLDVNGAVYFRSTLITDDTIKTRYTSNTRYNMTFSANSASANITAYDDTASENISLSLFASIHNKVVNSAVTNSALTHTVNYHRTSGTPAANFGSDWYLYLHSSTNTDRPAFLLRSQWVTATDASRAARVSLFAYDSGAARQALAIEASGTAAMIGFLGTAPIARPTVTGSRGGNAALASALTALANLGLITIVAGNRFGQGVVKS